MADMNPQERFWIFPKVNRPVFITSAALIVGFIAFGTIFNEFANTIFVGLQNLLAGYLGWALIILVNVLVLFVFFLAIEQPAVCKFCLACIIHPGFP